MSDPTQDRLSRLRAVVGDFEEAGEEELLRDYLLGWMPAPIREAQADGQIVMSRTYVLFNPKDERDEGEAVQVEWSRDGVNWQTASEMWGSQPLNDPPWEPIAATVDPEKFRAQMDALNAAMPALEREMSGVARGFREATERAFPPHTMAQWATATLETVDDADYSAPLVGVGEDPGIAQVVAICEALVTVAEED